MRSTSLWQQALLAVFLVFSGAGAGWAEPQTFVRFESEPGDYIGGGQLRTFRGVTVSQIGRGVSVNAGGYNYTFQAPIGASFVPGAYEGAIRYPFNDPPEPGLSVSGNGRGCNTLTGRFVLHEIAMGGGGVVSRLAVDFEQHCEGGGAALFGWIRFASEVPLHDSDADGVRDLQDNCVTVSNRPFEVGAYEGATRYPFNAPTVPGLDVSGNGRGCNTLTGRFDVLEVDGREARSCSSPAMAPSVSIATAVVRRAAARTQSCSRSC